MPRNYKPKGPSEYKITPRRGPTQETLDLGQKCLDLMGRGMARRDLAGRLGVTRKRVDHALRAMRQQAAGTAGEQARERPRRKHRVVTRRVTGTPPDWRWQDAAACKGKPLHWFFDPEGRELEAAKQARVTRGKNVCAVCPVRIECLDYAISRPEKGGTWGGLDEDERASERRKRMRAAADQRRADEEAA